MWLPPGWLIHAALHGLHGAAHSSADSARTAWVEQHTTKVVNCEKCKRCYTYDLKRSWYNVEQLQEALATGIEAIPCPACGWYQSNMILKAQNLHRRWVLYVGQCLTIGPIGPAVAGWVINAINEQEGRASIPWPIFWAGLAGLFIVGVGMLIEWLRLTINFNPNDQDVEARKLYGQSRAILLSEQEAKDRAAP
jgi:hypothetical protein